MVGAHVGLGLPQDRRRRARPVHLLQHPSAAGILDAAVQLAIGKGARAALAELHIAVGVEGTAVPEGRHVLLPPVHGLSPLHHHGLHARPCQGQRREQPRRPHADDQRQGCGHFTKCPPLQGKAARRTRDERGRPPTVAVSGSLHVFDLHRVLRQAHGPRGLHVQSQGEVNVPLVPGIHRFADQLRRQNVPGLHPQGAGSQLWQGKLIVVQLLSKLGDA